MLSGDREPTVEYYPFNLTVLTYTLIGFRNRGRRAV